jgi:hypothetical protein
MADLVPLSVRVERDLKDEILREAGRYQIDVSDIVRSALMKRTIHVDGQSLACGVLVDAMNALRQAADIPAALAAIEAGLVLLS